MMDVNETIDVLDVMYIFNSFGQKEKLELGENQIALHFNKADGLEGYTI